jgi:hypothetical protein
MRGARSRKHEKRKLAANNEKIAREQVEDFTPEQTAFLRRVREICDARRDQASANLQHDQLVSCISNSFTKEDLGFDSADAVRRGELLPSGKGTQETGD